MPLSVRDTAFLLIVSSSNPRARHEMPVQNELSKQNIQDRYHGRNDPVAKKILSTHAANMGLQPPEDQNIVRSFLVSFGECAADFSRHLSF